MFTKVKRPYPQVASPVLMACSHTGYCSVCGRLDSLSSAVLACVGGCAVEGIECVYVHVTYGLPCLPVRSKQTALLRSSTEIQSQMFCSLPFHHL